MYRKKTERLSHILLRTTLCAIIFYFLGLFFATPAFAVTDADLTKKALLNGLKTCATTQYFKAPISQSDFKNLDSIFTSTGKDDHVINVPTMVGNSIKDGDLSCYQVLNGYHKRGQDIKGLAEYSGKEITADKLTQIGYGSASNPDAKVVKQGCIQITYQYKQKKLFGDPEWKDAETHRYCFWIEDDIISITAKGNHNVTSTKPSSGKKGTVVLSGSYNNGVSPGYWLSVYTLEGSTGTIKLTNAGQGDMKWSDFKNGWDSVSSNLNKRDDIRHASVNFSESEGHNPAADDPTLIFGGSSSKLAMLRFFAGKSATWNSIKFSSTEKTALYRSYVKSQIDNGKVSYGDCGTLAEMKNKQGDSELYIYQPDTKKDNYCILNGADKVEKKFNGLRAGNDLLYPESFLKIVSSLMPQEIADRNQEIRHPESSGGSTSIDDDPQETACQDAAGSLSWIICPVMTTLSDATKNIYNSMIKPFLEINAGSVSSDSGVYTAWKQFRDYANIAFAIALAIVILSQLTGIGLTNYSIKKILPRLIMIVVLVNISFILCQLAVDVSNILGTALNDLLSNFAININEEMKATVGTDGDVFLGGNVLEDILTKFLSNKFLTGTTTFILGVSAVLSWNVWLVPLILAVISFLISTIFFFLILAIRQAGVFILITLAPLAIVCYALPNTKSLFDKWYKLFTALLIVYPICGLMMGGGQFASALLLNAGKGTQDQAGFFMLLAAVVVSVAPFFLIPTVVKNSMGALGNLGVKLSNFGSKAGSFVGGAFAGSWLGSQMKNRANERAESREMKRADRRNKMYLGAYKFADEHGIPMTRGIKTRAGKKANQLLASEKTRNANRLRSQQMGDAGGIKALMERQNRAQADELEKIETSNMLSQYQHGEIGGVNFNQLSAYDKYDEEGNGIGEMREDSLEAEYMRQLDALDANPEDREAQRKVKALQQHFATQGDKGRAVIQRSFESKLTSGHLDGAAYAARMIAADNKMFGDIKSADRGLFAMTGDLSTSQLDGNGRVVSSTAKTGADAAAHYGKQGTDKYTAQALANADEGALNRLVSGIRSGEISGEKLENLSSSAREALSNRNVQAKPEVKAALQNMAMAGYAQNATAESASRGIATAGSNVMAGSSAGEISSAASYIRKMNNGARFDATRDANNADYKMIQGMARNAQAALRDGDKTYSEEQIEAMQSVIKSARDMGVMNGSAEFTQVDPTTIRVRGGRSQGNAPQTPPPGYTESGIWLANGHGTSAREEMDIAHQRGRQGFGQNGPNNNGNNRSGNGNSNNGNNNGGSTIILP